MKYEAGPEVLETYQLLQTRRVQLGAVCQRARDERAGILGLPVIGKIIGLLEKTGADLTVGKSLHDAIILKENEIRSACYDLFRETRKAGGNFGIDIIRFYRRYSPHNDSGGIQIESHFDLNGEHFPMIFYQQSVEVRPSYPSEAVDELTLKMPSREALYRRESQKPVIIVPVGNGLPITLHEHTEFGRLLPKKGVMKVNSSFRLATFEGEGNLQPNYYNTHWID